MARKLHPAIAKACNECLSIVLQIIAEHVSLWAPAFLASGHRRPHDSKHIGAVDAYKPKVITVKGAAAAAGTHKITYLGPLEIAAASTTTSTTITATAGTTEADEDLDDENALGVFGSLFS